VKKVFKQIVITLFAVSLFLGGALGNAIPVQAATVKLNKSSVNIMVGKTTTLKLSGTAKKVTWKSSNQAIAVVRSNESLWQKRQEKQQ
jgi:heme A synthase